MKLIVISSSSAIENEIKIITQLFEAGLETFHLRKHRQSTKKIKAFLSEIPKQYHNRIVLHSHHKLARTFNLKGIHHTKTHRKKKFKTWFITRLIQMRHPSILITTSYGNIGSMLEQEKKYNYDYAFLSPIFDSLTNKYQSGYTEHSLKSAMQKSDKQIIARGGTSIDTLEKVNELGFAGVALYSCIWKKKDPVAEFNRIVERCQELKIKIE
ncbi:MAG: thiamine phosphate synthase [Bacteroidia bacterium]|nr:thiamine phosphate synthase [Bacteroidia bacterium]